MMVFLGSIAKNKYGADHFFQATQVESDGKFHTLLITVEHIVFIENTKKLVLWEFETENLKTVQEKSNGISICTRKKVDNVYISLIKFSLL
jgi:hypothetical protein